jgi:hypothetical protein
VITAVPTAREPVDVAWSTAAHAAYVSHRSGSVVVLGDDGAVHARIDASPGAGPLRFGPDGRRAILLTPDEGLVSVLDAATDRLVQTGRFDGHPDQVAFTDTLAYLRPRDGTEVRMLPLDAIGGEGEPLQAADFTGGSTPFGPAGLADAIVPALEAGAVLVANPGDNAVYYYQEGMAAPLGSFETPAEAPRAVRALDRSLRERAPGEYTALVQLPEAGRYELAVLLDQPGFVECFPLNVGSEEQSRVPTVVWELPTGPTRVGAPVRVAMDLTLNGAALPGMPGLQAIVLRAPGLDSERLPLVSDGDGHFYVTFTPATPGAWRVHLVADTLSAAAISPAEITVTE